MKKRQLRKEEQEFFEATEHELYDPDASPLDQPDLLPYKADYNIDKDRLILGTVSVNSFCICIYNVLLKLAQYALILI